MSHGANSTKCVLQETYASHWTNWESDSCSRPKSDKTHSTQQEINSFTPKQDPFFQDNVSTGPKLDKCKKTGPRNRNYTTLSARDSWHSFIHSLSEKAVKLTRFPFMSSPQSTSVQINDFFRFFCFFPSFTAILTTAVIWCCCLLCWFHILQSVLFHTASIAYFDNFTFSQRTSGTLFN